MPSGSRAGFGNAVAVLAADAKEEAPLVDRGGVDSTVGSEGQSIFKCCVSCAALRNYQL